MRIDLRVASQALWPPAGDRDGRLVPLLLALTFLTGLVDATSYLELGHVFVANMTGNVVFLGFALAGAKEVSAAASLIALGSFLCGARAGGALAARTGHRRGHLLRLGTAVQLTLLALAVALALIAASPLAKAIRYLIIALLSLAMGLQNAVAQRLNVAELTTTVLTRTLTGLAAELGPGAERSPVAVRRIAAVTAMLLGALAGGVLVLEASVAAALSAALGIAVVVMVAAPGASDPPSAPSGPGSQSNPSAPSPSAPNAASPTTGR